MACARVCAPKAVDVSITCMTAIEYMTIKFPINDIVANGYTRTVGISGLALLTSATGTRARQCVCVM